MKLTSSVVAACAFLVVGTAAPAAHAQFTFLGANTEANGISADGRVAVGTRNGNEAFVWRRGDGSQGLGAGTPSSTFGIAISGDGTTAAGGSSMGSYRWRGPGTFETLGSLPPPFNGTSATGVSNDGSVVVGWAGDPNVGPVGSFYWTESGGMQPIPVTDGQALGISRDGAVVVGTTRSSFIRGFTWTPSGGGRYLQSPDGVSVTYARAVNFNGTIVVGNSNPTTAPTIWTNEVPVLLPVPQGWVQGFSPSCVDDAGHVVAGVGGFQPGIPNAVVWNPNRGTELFSTYLTANGVEFPAGFVFSRITGVSADGLTFTGNGGTADVGGGFVVTVPAPGGVALGLLSSWISVRRKRRVFQVL